MTFDRELKRKVKEVNCLIEQYFSSMDSKEGIVFDAMRYSLRAGGKRLRPILLLETLRCFSSDENRYKIGESFALALEMIHTYSLVHDDLPAMDDDSFRRGMLSTHAKYGEANGILTGDALLNEAFLLISKTIEDVYEQNAPYDRNASKEWLGQLIKSQRILAECAGKDGMIMGQELDLSFSGKLVLEEEILLMYELKTSRLLQAAMTIGAVLGGAEKKQEENARLCAAYLGKAFQLQDDYLDLFGDANKLGKPIHSDIDKDKTTYLSLTGVEKTKTKIEEFTMASLHYLRQFQGDNNFLQELILSLLHRES